MLHCFISRRSAHLWLVAVVACLGFNAVARSDVPEDGKLGDCHNPSQYPEVSFCQEEAAPCLPAGCSEVSAFPYNCPTGGCPDGGCVHFRRTAFTPHGFCAAGNSGTAPDSRCNSCNYFACAFVEVYSSHDDCEGRINMRCTAVYWQNSACDP